MTNRVRCTRSAIKKGNIPRYMVSRGISLATPLMTNTFIPTGGVINAISAVMTIITPSHIGSRPRLVIIGKMRVTVRMAIARNSLTQPRII